MAKQLIITGTTPNDTTGDTLYSGAVKINENFTEVYEALSMGPSNFPVTSITSGLNSGIEVVTNGSSVTLANTTSIFSTVAVTGSSSIAASGLTDTLTFTGGNNITLAVTGKTITVSTPSQVQSNWTQLDEGATDYIKNKPGLSTVATSGYYADLLEKPLLATVATSGDYRDLSHLPALAQVATTGSYNNLSNTPFIPTDVSELTDNNYIINPAVPDTIKTVGNTISALTGDKIIVQPGNGIGPAWQFNSSGVLDFPDATYQTTAWAGGKIVSPPVSSLGVVGDTVGYMAFHETGIYYCIAAYDGLANIWVKTPWAVTGSW